MGDPLRSQSIEGSIELESLTLKAGERVLVSDVSLRMGCGEIWCIAGPNGAGKTTLMEVIAGLRRAEAGRVIVDERALTQWQPAELARRRSWMPQTTHDAFGATVLETVLVARHPWIGGWGWERDSDHAIARDALDAVDAAALADRDVTTLSGGERQRVALAAALCQQTPLLLLDEPLSHLDLRHQIESLRVVRDWVAAGRDQRMVVMSCHDLNLARQFATHAMLLDGRGHCIAGPVGHVLTAEHTSHAFGFPLVLMRDGDHEMLVPRFDPGPVD